MIYEFIPAHEAGEDIAKKLKDHSKGLSRPINLDWDYYIESSYSGRIWAVTARDKGDLIGYAVYIIDNNPNHKTVKEAHSIGIYIEPPYRGKISINLMKKATSFLEDIGVQQVHYTLECKKLARFLSFLKPKILENKIWVQLEK